MPPDARPRIHRSRLKFAGAVGLACVVLVWLITPTPRALYHPKNHVPAEGEVPDNGDIINSIVIPSYNEAENMAPLYVKRHYLDDCMLTLDPSVTRIFQALAPESVRHTEVLVVDDNSQDNTAEEIERLRENGYNVHLHVRTLERGLSSAVLFGFSKSRGQKLLVMDADLQHPPESVPALLDALSDESKQFALGTRYGKGVEMDKDWPVYRRFISWGARLLSRPLTNAQDPMGGFFALKRSLVRLDLTYPNACADHNLQYLACQPVNPSGFKLGLELLLKTPLASTALVHIPYGFSKRQSGSSKLGMKVILKYIGQLLALYYWRFGLLWFLFMGVMITAGVYAVLELADRAVRRLGAQESSLGRTVLLDRRKRRKTKSDV